MTWACWFWGCWWECDAWHRLRVCRRCRQRQVNTRAGWVDFSPELDGGTKLGKEITTPAFRNLWRTGK